MQFLKDLVTNHVLIATALAWAFAQGTKVVINFIKAKKLDLRVLFSNGGMPSGHTATVVSLTVMSGYAEGFGSAAFAIALILLMVVVRDATGVRLEVSKHAKAIKELARAAESTLPDKENGISTDNLKMHVGHTPSEVAVGTVIGVVVPIFYIILFLK